MDGVYFNQLAKGKCRFQKHGWGAGAVCFWPLVAGTAPTINTGAAAGARAGAAKITRLLYQLLDDKKHKKIDNLLIN